MFQTDVLSHHLASCSWGAFHSLWEFIMCLIKSLLNMNVISHFVNFSSTLAGFGLCLTMCLFSFEAIDAIKSQKLQCKSFRSSVDGKSPMWPSLVFTTSVCTLWVYEMCFSKSPSRFNVLSQRLHWISQLLLVMWTFKLPAVLKTVGQFSHLIAFLTPIHFVMWLLLLLCGFFLTVFAGKFPVRIRVCQ